MWQITQKAVVVLVLLVVVATSNQYQHFHHADSHCHGKAEAPCPCPEHQLDFGDIKCVDYISPITLNLIGFIFLSERVEKINIHKFGYSNFSKILFTTKIPIFQKYNSLII